MCTFAGHADQGADISQATRTEALPEQSLPEQALPDSAATASGLRRAVHSLLVSTCDAASLLTAQLEVTGCPALAASVHRSAPPVHEVLVWASRMPPTRWHGGLALVAAAAEADAERRATVAHTAALISELVAADARASQAETLAQRALELAGVDPLTQLGNRRTWRRALDEESRRSMRYGTPTTLVVVDLDGLKRLNDEQGHAAGDAYLQRGAESVRAAARSVDVICRLGGDEFGVLAPQTAPDGAARLEARLRAALAAAKVAASIGIATTADGHLDAAWQRADAGMYDDKRRRAQR